MRYLTPLSVICFTYKMKMINSVHEFNAEKTLQVFQEEMDLIQGNHAHKIVGWTGAVEITGATNGP